jgi:hypothetical protein
MAPPPGPEPLPLRWRNHPISIFGSASSLSQLAAADGTSLLVARAAVSSAAAEEAVALAPAAAAAPATRADDKDEAGQGRAALALFPRGRIGRSGRDSPEPAGAIVAGGPFGANAFGFCSEGDPRPLRAASSAGEEEEEEPQREEFGGGSAEPLAQAWLLVCSLSEPR